MESRGKWVNTRDDGVLLFKNVNLDLKETDKVDNKENDYEHKEENCVLEFDEDASKYPIGSKHFHTEMSVFCIVTDRTEGEDGKLQSFKVRLESLDSEAVID